MRIRRILVAVDASPGSLSAAEAAAELAAALEAELVGLFVEDVHLLRLGELPVARQLDRLSPTLRRPASRELELQLKVQAARAQAALEGIARRLRIAHRFETAQGKVAERILEAAREADLVALGRAGWSLRLRPALGSTARAVLDRGRGRVLLLGEASRLASPVLALYDGGEASRAAVLLAAAIAQRVEGEALVLVADADEAAGGDLSRRATELLEGAGARGEVRWLGSRDPSAIGEAVRRLGARSVVVPAGILGLDAAGLQQLLEELEHPVAAVY